MTSKSDLKTTENEKVNKLSIFRGLGRSKYLKSVFVSLGTGPSKSNLSGRKSSALSQTLCTFTVIAVKEKLFNYRKEWKIQHPQLTCIMD